MPGVVNCYLWYAGVTAFLSLLLATVAFRSPSLFSGGHDNLPEWFLAFMFGGGGLLCTIVYGAALFLPERPWAWTYGLVLIALGLGNCGTLVVCIPMLVYWFKPATKRFFDRA
jgi:hypothetical protein